MHQTTHVGNRSAYSSYSIDLEQSHAAFFSGQIFGVHGFCRLNVLSSRNLIAIVGFGKCGDLRYSIIQRSADCLPLARGCFGKFSARCGTHPLTATAYLIRRERPPLHNRAAAIRDSRLSDLHISAIMTYSVPGPSDSREDG